MSGRLDRGGNVTLNSAGAGTLTFGPGRQAEQWNITRITTKGSSTTDPTLDVLRGSNNVVDSTPHGNDDVSETQLSLYAGELISLRYTGGTAGAVMTIYLEGDVSYGGTA